MTLVWRGIKLWPMTECTESTKIPASDGARRVVDMASEKLATDIVMLDMRGPYSFTDYFVILTGETRRQMRALQEDIEELLQESGMRLHHREGSTDGGWVLLDYGDLVVHVFGPDEREFYQIESLWSQAPVLFRVQ